MTARSRSLLPLALTGCAIVLLTAACSGSGSSYGSGTGQQAAAQGNTGNAAAAQQGAAAAPALTAIRTFDIGRIVVDGRGFTVYRSDGDTASPSKAACVGKCAQDWPPLTITSAFKVSGIDQALVGSVLRPDGVEQVTLAGWPLYSHAADEMPGETSGQGVGGTWFAIAPDGKKVEVAENPGLSGEFGL
jgi:predicted lipoprotein with Yx(FWY)xxD motif